MEKIYPQVVNLLACCRKREALVKVLTQQKDLEARVEIGRLKRVFSPKHAQFPE